MKFMKQYTLLLLFMTLLVACSPAGEPAASEQQAVSVAEEVEQPTAVTQPDTPRTEELPVPAMEEPTQEEAAETASETAEEPEATSAPPETEPMALPENEDTTEEEAPIAETAVDPVEAPAEENTTGVISGRLDEGAFFLGDPNAPVTLIDYSDFL